MKGSTVVKGRVVQGEKDEVVSAAGLHPLGEFAERLGLVETLREAIGWRGNGIPLRDRGVLAVQLMLMLAGVGAVCSKIERLRCEEELFGTVASDTTLWRTFTETIDEAARSRVEVVFRDAREVMWEKLGFLDGDDTVILDIDATLVNTHSDDHKELTGPNYKGGYGMHPMACFADCTGEALSFLLRPGNATANDAKDHLTVLDAAVDALPAVLAAGHRVGDPPDAVLREMLVRADSAGCTAEFVAGCGKRNIRFAVTVRQTKDVARAAGYAHIVHKNRWRRAVDQNGKVSEKNKAWVCEITDLVTPPKGMPAGTRTILRRERRHPGAQRSLFPDENWRFWAHYTDSDLNPVELDRQMRAHAHCEASIQRLKGSGLHKMPFKDADANRAWQQFVAMGHSLVRWFQQACLTSEWIDAKPDKLRTWLWITPARIIRSGRQTTFRVNRNWPTAAVISGAYQAMDRLRL